MSERPFFSMPYPGIFRVTAPLMFPGLNHVHVYLAEGRDGGLVMFDTTLGYKDSMARLEQGIAWLDRSLTDVEAIYLTHAHPDHVALAKTFQEASGAPVYCHPIAHEMLQWMQAPDRAERAFGGYAEHGWTGDPNREPGFRIPVPERIRHLEEGDEVRFAGGDWRVLWTPGHEWGHIVFFREADRLLLTGDTLLAKITPNISYHGVPEDPLGMFLATLDRLAELRPSFTLPGHGRPFEEGAERARAIRSHHEQRLRRILEVLLKEAATGMEVAWTLFGRDLMYFEERLALAETLAHLEHLRLRGRVTREMRDGLWRYEVAPSLVP